MLFLTAQILKEYRTNKIMFFSLQVINYQSPEHPIAFLPCSPKSRFYTVCETKGCYESEGRDESVRKNPLNMNPWKSSFFVVKYAYNKCYNVTCNFLKFLFSEQ